MKKQEKSTNRPGKEQKRSRKRAEKEPEQSCLSHQMLPSQQRANFESDGLCVFLFDEVTGSAAVHRAGANAEQFTRGKGAGGRAVRHQHSEGKSGGHKRCHPYMPIWCFSGWSVGGEAPCRLPQPLQLTRERCSQSLFEACGQLVAQGGRVGFCNLRPHAAVWPGSLQ